MSGKFLPHRVLHERAADGSILLRSAHEMGKVANVTGDWLHRWAQEAGDRVFIAERDGDGWREITYAQTLAKVQAMAASLVGMGLGENTPIMVISGNGVDHALLALAAQYVGIPLVPLAEQYALMPGAHGRLRHAVELTKPKLVYAIDGTRYAEALKLPEIASLNIVVSRNPGKGMALFDELLDGNSKVDLAQVHAAIGPESVAKILLTSGSTSNPKGVITTHRMMCSNQAQISAVLPFLTQKPPCIVDWLPWNHVFGGSHNFNMILANGGSLYIDDGKPVKGLVDRTIENLGLVSGNIWFNVPVGFGMVAEAMKNDKKLRETVFSKLDMLFYAGASLPQEIWKTLEDMAMEVRGELPMFTSSWGLTETAPAMSLQHEPTNRSGIIGVPLPGVTAKLIPDEGMRCEIRVKGPNLMPGYFENPSKTREAFDEEGYFRTGDAVRFVDENDFDKGLKFDGRISEDFKLLSGTWVRAANLRLDVLGCLPGVAQDVVITGEGRADIGLMVFPTPAFVEQLGKRMENRDGAFVGEALLQILQERLAGMSGAELGSAMRVVRAIVLAEPPSIGDGEITAKGNLNFHKVLERRAELLERLYDDKDAATVLLG